MECSPDDTSLIAHERSHHTLSTPCTTSECTCLSRMPCDMHIYISWTTFDGTDVVNYESADKSVTAHLNLPVLRRDYTNSVPDSVNHLPHFDSSIDSSSYSCRGQAERERIHPSKYSRRAKTPAQSKLRQSNRIANPPYEHLLHPPYNSRARQPSCQYHARPSIATSAQTQYTPSDSSQSTPRYVPEFPDPTGDYQDWSFPRDTAQDMEDEEENVHYSWTQ